jgi:hypothetical protein
MTGMSSGWMRAFRRYERASSLLVAGLLLFALVNVAASLWIRLGGRRSTIRRHFDLSLVAKAYPDLGRQQVAELLREQERVDVQEYEPLTDSRPPAFEGRYIHVSRAGFRAVADQAPWPPDARDIAVFFFGGSTAFGYGLPDGETIPSLLQVALRRAWPSRRTAVYNFGRPAYFSSQERALFEQLLVSGRRPSIAVFFDGLNEFLFRDDPHGDPPWRTAHSEVLRRLDRESGQHLTLHLTFALLRGLPLTRAFAAARRPPGLETGLEPDAAAADAIVRRYRANRALLESATRSSGIEALFVVQPISTYRYDTRRHLFGREELAATRRATAGYEVLDPDRQPSLRAPDVLGLAGIQEESRENLYVDWLHYGAALSRDIAGRIAARLIALGEPP